MLVDETALRDKAPRIRSLPDGPVLLKEDLLTADNRLGVEGKVEVYHAPFHFLNEKARVVLVGITPSWAQTELVTRRLRDELRNGTDLEVACRLAVQEAPFAG